MSGVADGAGVLAAVSGVQHNDKFLPIRDGALFFLQFQQQRQQRVGAADGVDVQHKPVSVFFHRRHAPGFVPHVSVERKDESEGVRVVSGGAETRKVGGVCDGGFDGAGDGVIAVLNGKIQGDSGGILESVYLVVQRAVGFEDESGAIGGGPQPRFATFGGAGGISRQGESCGQKQGEKKRKFGGHSEARFFVEPEL